MIGNQFLRSLYHSIVYNALYRRELMRASRMAFDGLELVIDPAVHHPGIFKSGIVFARMLAGLDLRARTVLDMGTGSGILGLTAALRGATVVAVDKDPAAVQCATENVRRNRLQTKVSVLGGDLFSTMPNCTFDVILFNPPYYLETTGSFRDTALYGGSSLEIVRKFAESAARYVTPTGYILMIISSDSDVGRFLQIFRDLNYDASIHATQKTLFEMFYVYKFEPPRLRKKVIH